MSRSLMPLTSDCVQGFSDGRFGLECGDIAGFLATQDANDVMRLLPKKHMNIVDQNVSVLSRSKTIRPFAVSCSQLNGCSDTLLSESDLRLCIELRDCLQRKRTTLRVPNKGKKMVLKKSQPVVQHLAKLMELTDAITVHYNLRNCLTVWPFPNVDGGVFAAFPCYQRSSQVSLLWLYYDHNAELLGYSNLKHLQCEGSVLQLDSAAPVNAQSPILCAVRTTSNLSLIVMQQYCENLRKIDISQRLSDNSIDVHCNRLLFGEVFLLQQNGNIRIFDLERPDFEETRCVAMNSSAVSSSTSGHPRILSVCDPKSILCYDLRNWRDNSSPSVLLEICGDTASEKLCLHRCFDAEPHLSVAAGTSSLFLLDHRFPRRPVSSWKHMLIALPAFLTPVDIFKSRIMAVGSREHGDVHLFSGCVDSNDIFASHSPPLRLQKPDDIVCWFQTHKCEVVPSSETIKRLNAPLLGTGFLPLDCSLNTKAESLNKINVCFLQLNVFSDMFYETMRFVPDPCPIEGVVGSDFSSAAEEFELWFENIQRKPMKLFSASVKRPKIKRNVLKTFSKTPIPLCAGCDGSCNDPEDISTFDGSEHCVVCKYRVLTENTIEEVSGSEKAFEVNMPQAEDNLATYPKPEDVASDPCAIFYAEWFTDN